MKTKIRETTARSMTKTKKLNSKPKDYKNLKKSSKPNPSKWVLNCNLCDRRINRGEEYYALEIAHCRIDTKIPKKDLYSTTALGVRELSIWCNACYCGKFPASLVKH